MAFSTFRGLMAASNSSSPPPSLTDIFAAEANTGWNGNGSAVWVCPGTSTAYYAVGTISSSDPVNAWIVNKGAGYSYLSAALGMDSAARIAAGSSCDTITTTSFLAVWVDPSTGVQASYVVNSSGTLNDPIGYYPVIGSNTGSYLQVLCIVLDSSNALVFGTDVTSATHNQMSLINPVTLTITQNSTSATSIANSGKVGLVKISPTLAAFSYVNSGTVYIASVTIVSGTSFTINTPYNTGLSASNGAYPVLYSISSTTALMAYYKTTNTLAARVVTFSGGSVSLGTEYTVTAANIYNNYPLFSITSYASGTKYVIAYAEVITGSSTYYGGRVLATEVTITGSVVNFGTNGFYAIKTASDGLSTQTFSGSGGYAYSNDQLITVDSTHIAMNTFGTSPVGGTSPSIYAYGYTAYVDVNPTIQTWGSLSGTHGRSNLTPVVSSNAINSNVSMICIGSGRYFTVANTGGGTASWCSAFTITGSTSPTPFASNADTSTGSNGVSAISALGYDTTDGYSRALTAYASGTNVNTVSIALWTVDNSSIVTNPGSNSFTISNSSLSGSNNGQYGLVQLGADTTLCYVVDGASGHGSSGILKACIITTSTTTVNTPGSLNTIYSPGASSYVQVGTAGPQAVMIDSTHVALIYSVYNGSTYSIQLVICSISGSTITAGTPVTIVSSLGNKPANFGVAALATGTGMVVYTSDTSPATSIHANGFTYSGTTITLGSQNTVITGTSMPNTPGYLTWNGSPVILQVSGTEAVICWTDSSPIFYVTMLTYVNVNSITAGSNQTINALGGTIAKQGLVRTDNYNNVFGVYFYDGATYFSEYYRA